MQGREIARVPRLLAALVFWEIGPRGHSGDKRRQPRDSGAQVGQVDARVDVHKASTLPSAHQVVGKQEPPHGSVDRFFGIPLAEEAAMFARMAPCS
jgi:hypothetical protein